MATNPARGESASSTGLGREARGEIAGNGRLADIDPSFRVDRSIEFRHQLASHPLLQMPALIALAGRLPPDAVRFHAAAMSADTDFSDEPAIPRAKATLEDALAGIEQAGAWVQFKHIEQDPLYRALIDRFLDEARPLMGGDATSMGQREGYIFIASPGSVTPYHCDHELNFICQIRGPKEFHVWDPADRSVLSQEQLESFHAEYSLKNIRYDEKLEARARVHSLGSGQGIYMPLAAPHLVRTGAAAAITLSVVFITDSARREAAVHSANYLLRRLGVEPREPGISPVVDSAKRRGLGVITRVRSLLGGARKRG